MIDLTWDGNPDTLAQMEAEVRTADWVINRIRTQFTSGAIDEIMAATKLADIGVLPARIDQYLRAWRLVVAQPRTRARLGPARQNNAPPRGLPNTPAPPLPAQLPMPGEIGIGAGVAFDYPPSTGGGRRG